MPTAPPFNVAQLVADFTSGAVAKNYPAVSASKLESSYKTLSQQNPQLATVIGKISYRDAAAGVVASNLELCLNRVAGEDNTSDVEPSCGQLMTNLISYSNKTGDATVIDFTKSVIGYCVHPKYAIRWVATPTWIFLLQELQKNG